MSVRTSCAGSRNSSRYLVNGSKTVPGMCRHCGQQPGWEACGGNSIRRSVTATCIHNHVAAPKGTASDGSLNQADGFVVASNMHGLDVPVAAFAKEVASWVKWGQAQGARAVGDGAQICDIRPTHGACPVCCPLHMWRNHCKNWCCGCCTTEGSCKLGSSRCALPSRPSSCITSSPAAEV